MHEAALPHACAKRLAFQHKNMSLPARVSQKYAARPSQPRKKFATPRTTEGAPYNEAARAATGTRYRRVHKKKRFIKARPHRQTDRPYETL